VDEKKLADLFQSVVADPPPASFDERDVALAAKRADTLRRSRIVGSGALGVVVLAVVGLFLVTGGFGHTAGSGTDASAGAALPPRSTSNDNGQVFPPLAATNGGPQVISPTHFPHSTPKQGGGEGGRAGPAGGTHAGCGPTDAELAVALANELPSVGAKTAVPTAVSCPDGSRSAAYVVHNTTTGAGDGTVVAILVPVDATGLFSDSTPGLAGDTGKSHSGRYTVVLLSQPADGSTAAPLATQLSAVQRALAAKF
jgi:hypothetical protein